MKLHCLYTDDHEPMLIRFLAGVTDDVEIKLSNMSQLSLSKGLIGGGVASWKFKSNLLAEISDPALHPADELVIMIDIDIDVFADLAPVVRTQLEHLDIVLQREAPDREGYNIGGMAFRPSERVSKFWRDVEDEIDRTGGWDQLVVNNLLFSDDYKASNPIRSGYFPNTVWCQTLGRDGAPYGAAVLHHANYAEGTYPHDNLSMLEKKWLVMNMWRPLFSLDWSRTAASFELVHSKLTSAEWTFGRIGDQQPYGTMRFGANTIEGYDHPHERTYEMNGTGLKIFADSGRCHLWFNEYYVDRFRNKLMCVGVNPFSTAPDHDLRLQYLMTEL